MSSWGLGQLIIMTLRRLRPALPAESCETVTQTKAWEETELTINVMYHKVRAWIKTKHDYEKGHDYDS